MLVGIVWPLPPSLPTLISYHLQIPAAPGRAIQIISSYQLQPAPAPLVPLLPAARGSIVQYVLITRTTPACPAPTRRISTLNTLVFPPVATTARGDVWQGTLRWPIPPESAMVAVLAVTLTLLGLRSAPRAQLVSILRALHPLVALLVRTPLLSMPTSLPQLL